MRMPTHSTTAASRLTTTSMCTFQQQPRQLHYDRVELALLPAAKMGCSAGIHTSSHYQISIEQCFECKYGLGNVGSYSNLAAITSKKCGKVPTVGSKTIHSKVNSRSCLRTTDVRHCQKSATKKNQVARCIPQSALPPLRLAARRSWLPPTLSCSRGPPRAVDRAGLRLKRTSQRSCACSAVPAWEPPYRSRGPGLRVGAVHSRHGPVRAASPQGVGSAAGPLYGYGPAAVTCDVLGKNILLLLRRTSCPTASARMLT